MTKEEVIVLLERYQEGSCTPKEKIFVDGWYVDEVKKNKDVELESGNEFWINKEARYLHILSSRPSALKPLPVKPMSSKTSTLKTSISLFQRYRWMAAGCILLCISVLYVLLRNPVSDIIPGRDKAILTLANGKQIILSDVKNGELAIQSGMRITKTDREEITFTRIDSASNSTSKIPDNNATRIETPYGSQFAVVLPDHSKVWLNAVSMLKFPANFTNAVRKVELSGEAYFEVAKDKSRPFVVKTDMQDVEVLGTHFNVNSYADGQTTKTTLIEGAVKIIPSSLFSGSAGSKTNKARVLVPNEESTLTKNSFNVKTVDPLESIAWKDGFFTFNDEGIVDAMVEICHWYNVEISYADDRLKDEKITGASPKYDSVSDVLKVLEKTANVHFTIEGRRITVRK